MSFRVSALVTAAAVLGLGSVTPASAQPQAPMRPRNSAFGSIFTPGLQQQQQQQLLFGNQGGFGVPNAPGFARTSANSENASTGITRMPAEARPVKRVVL